MREIYYLLLTILFTLWVSILAVWYVWVSQTEGKIPDSGFAMIPDLSDSDFVYMPNVGLGILFVCFLWVSENYGVLGQLAILQCIFSIFRAFTVSATLLPNIKVYEFCKQRPDSLWQTVEFVMAHGTCSDYMFSGHTVTAMLMYMFVNKYRKSYWTELVAGLILGATIFSLLLFRWHYTDDIIIAAVLSWFGFQFYFQYACDYAKYWVYFPELLQYSFPLARKKANDLNALNSNTGNTNGVYRQLRVF